MEIENQVEKPKKEKVSKKVTLRQLDSEGAKLLSTLSEKANKKTFGRRVRDSEIITKALSLMKPEDLIELQERCYSGKDILQMRYEEYQRTNGKLKFDEFLSKLASIDLSAL